MEFFIFGLAILEKKAINHFHTNHWLLSWCYQGEYQYTRSGIDIHVEIYTKVLNEVKLKRFWIWLLSRTLNKIKTFEISKNLKLYDKADLNRTYHTILYQHHQYTAIETWYNCMCILKIVERREKFIFNNSLINSYELYRPSHQ